jgi:hypothetical protein
MAAKRTLKYKRNRLPPLLEFVHELIDKCFRSIESPGFKATISGLIQLIRFRLSVEPLKTPARIITWLDRLAPDLHEPSPG